MSLVKKKIFKLALCAVLGVGVLIPTTISFASNDKYGYSFTIKANQGNSSTSSRYRETTNPKNSWKVAMTNSGEGTFSITTYWLENNSGTNVSKSINVVADGSNYYTSAYDNASKTNVRLTAQNNNYTNQSYGVSGYWDEETGLLVNF